MRDGEGETEAGPFFLPVLETPSVGVDFLGLRQVNLDMMSRCLPGMNNTTRYVRPFTVLAWAHKRFADMNRDRESRKIGRAEYRAYLEKIEVLFAWGARLAGDVDRLPGTGAVPPGEGRVPLTFKAWKRKASSTGLMAPLWYGPASKTTGGYGFLAPEEGGFFDVTREGVALADCLDAVLADLPDDVAATLNEPGSSEGDAEQAAALWRVWGIGVEVPGEDAVFRRSFCVEDTVGRYDSLRGQRSSSLALMQHALAYAGRPVNEAEIRDLLIHAKESGRPPMEVPADLRQAWLRFAGMQMRQLQRAVLENLMSWVEECSLRAEGATADQLLFYAAEELMGTPETWTLRTPFKEVIGAGPRFEKLPDLLHAGAEAEALSPMQAIARLQRARRARNGFIPAMLRALPLLMEYTRIAAHETPDEIAAGGSAALSMKHFRVMLDSHREAELATALAFMIETMVVSQHLATALRRFKDRTHRLRFTIEEEGLVTLNGQAWRPAVTEDRVGVALALMADCGMIRSLGEGYAA